MSKGLCGLVINIWRYFSSLKHRIALIFSIKQYGDDKEESHQALAASLIRRFVEKRVAGETPAG
jgi:hypothetical protein